MNLLLWKNKCDDIEPFLCAIRNDFTEIDALLTSCCHYLNFPPANEDQHKNDIVWSYGNEPTQFFIKDLQNFDVPPYQAKINPNKYPVYVKTYPLSKEKEEGIKSVIESLLQQGVVVKRRFNNNKSYFNERDE